VRSEPVEFERIALYIEMIRRFTIGCGLPIRPTIGSRKGSKSRRGKTFIASCNSHAFARNWTFRFSLTGISLRRRQAVRLTACALAGTLW
jgi:hypothetical protein